jgi:hypothetical protein
MFRKLSPGIGMCLIAASMVAMVAVPSAAWATFGGANVTNGDIAFDSTVCGAFQIYYVNPASPPGNGCPAWSNNMQTQGFDDSSPFYTADTKTVYFQSNRTNSGGSPSAIWSIGSVFAGNAVDGATQVTNPAASSDFAPTVTADGTRLGFIRCNSVSNTCGLWTMPLPAGALAQETTDFPVVNPSSGNVTSDRPEFNPVNGAQILYECQVTILGVPYGHICLHTLGHGVADVDLTDQAESTSPWPHTDENADFRYDGLSIVFDTTGGFTSGNSGSAAGNVVFKMAFDGAAASGATSVWPGVAGQGAEIQPIYSPDGKNYAWTENSNGSYIEDWGGFGAPHLVSSTRTHSSQPTWEGMPQAGVAEAPVAALIPLAGLGLGGVAVVLGRRRRVADRRGASPA